MAPAALGSDHRMRGTRRDREAIDHARARSNKAPAIPATDTPGTDLPLGIELANGSEFKKVKIRYTPKHSL